MKRSFTVSLLALALVASGWNTVGSYSQAVAATGQNTAADDIEDLRKTLAEVLRARRPQEFAFLDRVVEMVDQGTLPRSLVVSTFNWARKKPQHPFQYFEYGLRERAKRIGIHI